MSHKFDDFIKRAGFSSTFERDRLYRLIELVIVECGQEVDQRSFLNYKYPNAKASEMLAEIFGIQNE